MTKTTYLLPHVYAEALRLGADFLETTQESSEDIEHAKRNALMHLVAHPDFVALSKEKRIQAWDELMNALEVLSEESTGLPPDTKVNMGIIDSSPLKQAKLKMRNIDRFRKRIAISKQFISRFLLGFLPRTFFYHLVISLIMVTALAHLYALSQKHYDIKAKRFNSNEAFSLLGLTEHQYFEYLAMWGPVPAELILKGTTHYYLLPIGQVKSLKGFFITYSIQIVILIFLRPLTKKENSQ